MYGSNKKNLQEKIIVEVFLSINIEAEQAVLKQKKITKETLKMKQFSQSIYAITYSQSSFIS
jgi:hypothetical protein